MNERFTQQQTNMHSVEHSCCWTSICSNTVAF